MKIAGIFKGILWLLLAYVYASLVGGRLPYFILYASMGVMLVSFIWVRSIRNVTVQASLHTNRSEVGREVVLKFNIQNLSFVPIPWVHCNMKLPEVFGPERKEVAFGMFLRGYEKVELAVPLECHVRGFFQWGRIELRAGDVFNILDSLRVFESRLNLLVRPRALYLGRGFSRNIDGGYGDRIRSLKPGRQISEFRGVRPYTPGDSMGSIHWKASVKNQRFLVKEHEQSMLNEIMLFLDFSSTSHYGLAYENTLERAVEVAASLAATSVQEGLKVGCAINSDTLLIIPPGHAKGQLGLILDFLARAIPGTSQGLSEALIKEGLQRPKGAMLVIVTPALDEELMLTLTGIAGKGYKTFVALIKPESFGSTVVDIEARNINVTKLRLSKIQVMPIGKEEDLRMLFGGMQHEAC